MAEEEKDHHDVDVIVALNRLRPEAQPQVKQQFAKAFAQALDVAGVEPGEAFFLVTSVLWEELKEQRDDALQSQREAETELEEKGEEAEETVKEYTTKLKALDELMADVDRGILTWDEFKDQVDAMGALEAA